MEECLCGSEVNPLCREHGAPRTHGCPHGLTGEAALWCLDCEEDAAPSNVAAARRALSGDAGGDR